MADFFDLIRNFELTGVSMADFEASRYIQWESNVSLET